MKAYVGSGDIAPRIIITSALSTTLLFATCPRGVTLVKHRVMSSWHCA
jgi:hypothetical protein